MERVIALVHGSTPALVVTLGTEMVMEAQRNPRFRATIDNAALAVCDTIGLLLISRVRGGPLRERVTGVGLVEALAKRSPSNALSFFLLGGLEGTAERAAGALAAAGATIAGTHHGYFSPEENARVASAVRASGANILLAALGSPKQELWLAQFLDTTGCKVGIGIGGTLDVLAGNVRRAPRLFQRLGLEWLYRLAREPRRWRRQLALPAFLLLALRESVQLRFSGGKTTG